MNKQELFKLWSEVLSGDEDSKDVLVGMYLSKFPHNSWVTSEINKEKLRTMYLKLLEITN